MKNQEQLISQMKLRMDVARKKAKADLVIRNANVVNVFLRSVSLSDVAVSGGIIAGIYPAGEGPEAEKTVDAEEQYMIPGLIDAHTHVEMAYISPSSFVECALPMGTTTVLMDPHDTVNAMGNEGLRILADEFEKTPIKTVLMTPPCVPSAPEFEDAGFEVTLESLKESRSIPMIHGIAETMDFNRVLAQEEEMMKILAYGRENELIFDGHAPEVRGLDAQAYFGTGPVRTDHESVTVDEMYEKYGLGVHVIIRRGSLAEPASAGELVKRLPDTSRLLLATDGCITINDMLTKGHMNYALQQIVAEGVDPMTAVQMATVNVARAHRIDHRVGAIAPGLEADMVLVNNLKEFKPSKVFINGMEVPEKLTLERPVYPEKALNTVVLPDGLCAESFEIKAPENASEVKVRAIHVIDGTVATEIHEYTLPVTDGIVTADVSKDVLKGAVIERYGRGKGLCAGFIHGFNMKKGAVAGSIGQDSQNICAVGTSDEDILAAVKEVERMQGGVAIAVDGEITATIEMPLFGIMSYKTAEDAEKEFAALQAEFERLGGTLNDVVFTISLLLTLVVIPEAGLSNRGLVDVSEGTFRDIIVSSSFQAV